MHNRDSPVRKPEARKGATICFERWQPHYQRVNRRTRINPCQLPCSHECERIKILCSRRTGHPPIATERHISALVLPEFYSHRIGRVFSSRLEYHVRTIRFSVSFVAEPTLRRSPFSRFQDWLFGAHLHRKRREAHVKYVCAD